MFVDLGVNYDIAAARSLSIQWSRFDNASRQKSLLSGEARFTVPEASSGEYLAADIHDGDSTRAVTVYVRKEPGGFRIVGVERGW